MCVVSVSLLESVSCYYRLKMKAVVYLYPLGSCALCPLPLPLPPPSPPALLALLHRRRVAPPPAAPARPRAARVPRESSCVLVSRVCDVCVLRRV